MSFIEDKERGKIGENLVRAYFAQEGCEIRDTSEEEQFWKSDIDFIVADSISYEVKTDYRFSATGNFALEDSYINAHGKIKSWLWTSKADRFAFVNPRNLSEFYCIDSSTLRELVQRESLKTAVRDDGYKLINLILLPLDKYIDLFEICEL